jgi:hypothetical protein
MESALAIVGVIALIEFFLVMGLREIARQRKEEIDELKAERHRLLTETVRQLKRQELPCDAEGVYKESGPVYIGPYNKYQGGDIRSAVECGDIHGAD